MILTTKCEMGFLRHNSLCRNNISKQKEDPHGILDKEIYIPMLSNYAIPSGVAPQQSSSPLHVTVRTNMNIKSN